ncbi:metallophosphoesterase [Aureimonas leprariae]|uniref:metallophosphoesterase n=1 Tax=Plantimonas leprariae TaxID=2615207 RepID=UPI0013874917|nr:metallophosphoesterase [Aureimonas leprariae]
MSVAGILRAAVRRLRGRNGGGSRRERLFVGEGNPIFYAVGDVHGCHEQLVEIDRLIVEDGQASQRPKIVVMLGDYVDRGPASADVLDHLTGGMPDGFRRVCLCGNHEEMMLRFLKEPFGNLFWFEHGGEVTLKSYGLDLRPILKTHRRHPKEVAEIVRDAVSAEHIEFLRALPVCAYTDRLVFAHAGVRPGVALRRQTDDDLMWIREPFLSKGPELPLVVVHGHTPSSRPVCGRGRIGLDTAACETGRLTALRWDGVQVKLLQTGPRSG